MRKEPIVSLPFKTLIFATHNQGKVTEVQKMLKPFAVNVQSAVEFDLISPEETGKTFSENAFIKAEYVVKQLSQWALADDSGLEIEILDQAPSIHSADWALDEKGERDYEKAMAKIYYHLLEKDAFLKKQTKARFVTVFCLMSAKGQIHYFRGETEGEIVWPPRGQNGFGYDAIFQPCGYRKTFAEMEAEEKLYGNFTEEAMYKKDRDPLAHRARALKKMLSFLRSRLIE